jgi:hypothetical protein
MGSQLKPWVKATPSLMQITHVMFLIILVELVAESLYSCSISTNKGAFGI